MSPFLHTCFAHFIHHSHKDVPLPLSFFLSFPVILSWFYFSITTLSTLHFSLEKVSKVKSLSFYIFSLILNVLIISLIRLQHSRFATFFFSLRSMPLDILLWNGSIISQLGQPLYALCVIHCLLEAKLMTWSFFFHRRCWKKL